MQVITHQFITFGCDHGELECAGRAVFMNVGGSLLWFLFFCIRKDPKCSLQLMWFTSNKAQRNINFNSSNG
ncbi:hypothetical protein CWB58_09305 [Pseudoalteromonas sp. S201]|jgi:hypothetical protein|nr:hypothetical protein CWB58_09305 [Pseudoalteromonas sp. S201]